MYRVIQNEPDVHPSGPRNSIIRTACARLKARHTRLRENEEGSVTVEFTLWVPLIGAIFLLIADFTFMFMVNASMWEAARNAARSIAMHQADASAAEATARKALMQNGAEYNVQIETNTRDVTVRISVAAADAGLIGFATSQLGFDLVAFTSMPREPV